MPKLYDNEERFQDFDYGVEHSVEEAEDLTLLQVFSKKRLEEVLLEGLSEEEQEDGRKRVAVRPFPTAAKMFISALKAETREYTISAAYCLITKLGIAVLKQREEIGAAIAAKEKSRKELRIAPAAQVFEPLEYALQVPILGSPTHRADNSVDPADRGRCGGPSS
jgi:hypothetical protein